MRLGLMAVVLLLSLTACPGAPGDNLTPEQSQGLALIRQRGCLGCHSTDGTRRMGPTFQGLYGREVTLDDRTMVTADEGYLRTAIGEPDATTVDGFPPDVMARAVAPGSIPREEIDAMIAYIRTLR